ncbi:metallophosphoesterase [Thalassotalea marina]|uniref:Calcineurin-like phosphoesterase domain-containing protein n=1 Tax=Thalassotalea marina TaxID=1673741 RepID=A0A919BLV2_9GAMM|nr:metallophosphoesterase [Thalassotalea marina]GHG00362.1 hypothetical protein GCM10017161_31280 [Thalassotalea marina]
MKISPLHCVLPLTLAIAACSTIHKENTNSANTPKITSFLAFGDGGYSVDYPKQKHINNPKTKAEFIQAEREDWLAEYRPIEEFGHAPIHVYPNTNIATEKSGALPVGVAMATLCQQKSCEFGIQLGDNIYPDGADANDGKDDQKRMNDLILAPLLPLINQQADFKVYSALGNHDWKTSRKGVALQTAWMQKQPNFHMDSQGYYRYTIGKKGQDIEFFVLDTNMLLTGQTFYEIPLNPDGSESDLSTALANGSAKLEDFERHETPINGEDKKQIAWLKAGLKNSTAKWKIVYGHHILWSIGGTKYDEGHVLRRLIMPSLCQYADAYIAGHEHDLELLTDDCSLYPESQGKPALPLIISGAASKMRGVHTPLARFQEKAYPQYELLWNKAFAWGFAHIEINHQTEQLGVSFYTTPNDGSGALHHEADFTFQARH